MKLCRCCRHYAFTDRDDDGWLFRCCLMVFATAPLFYAFADEYYTTYLHASAFALLLELIIYIS